MSKAAHTFLTSAWLDKGATIGRLWSSYSPPARPSSADLKIFRHFLAEGSNCADQSSSPGLLLGCTPELQDLLAGLALQFDCLDASRRNYLLMRRLRATSGQGRLVKCNWTHYRGRPRPWIVGDAALNMLPWHMWPAVLANLRCLLERGGSLIHRFYLWRDEDEQALGLLSPKAVGAASQASHEPHISIYAAIVFELYRGLVDRTSYQVSFLLWRDAVLRLQQAGVLSEEDVSSMRYLFQQAKVDFRLTIPPRARLEALLDRAGLLVEAVEFSDSGLPFEKNCPIYLIRRPV